MEFLALLKEIIVGTWDYLKFLYLVDHWEEAVILRNGKYHRSRTSGLYWKWPFFEYDLKANVKPDTTSIDPISITTKDKKTIAIGVILYYYVEDIKLFLVEHNDSMSNIVDKTTGELSDLIEEKEWEAIKSKSVKTALMNKLIPDFKKLGVVLTDLDWSSKCEVKAWKFFTGTQANKPTLV